MERCWDIAAPSLSCSRCWDVAAPLPLLSLLVQCPLLRNLLLVWHIVKTDDPVWIHHCKLTCIVHRWDLLCILYIIFHRVVDASSVTGSNRALTAHKAVGPPVYPSLSASKPLATTNLFTVSTVLTFPKCGIIRILAYTAFQIALFT